MDAHSGIALHKDGSREVHPDHSAERFVEPESNLKIMYSNSGAWAPQWGTVAGANSAMGKLSFRPNEGVADPASIPTPATAGTYKIELDFSENTYRITQ